MNADNTDGLRSIAGTTAGRAYRVHQRCPFKKAFYLLFSTCLDPLYQRTLATKNDVGGIFVLLEPVVLYVNTETHGLVHCMHVINSKGVVGWFRVYDQYLYERMLEEVEAQ
jgi:hypothetical protein